jgi:outer membrane receptor protein involved in Fe transport
LRGEWEWRGFDLVATGNYIADFEDDPAFIYGNTVLGGTIANPSFALHRRVSEYETLDMQLSYEFKKPAATESAPTYAKDAKDGKAVAQTAADSSTIWQRMLWNTKLIVGVNNVFDRYPPSVLGAFNDNYDTSLYNIRNRYWYVSLDKKF